MSIESILDSLTPGQRDLIKEKIEKETEKATIQERKAIVQYIKSRVGFWNSNSNVNKKINRLAEDVSNQVHHRVQQDNGSENS